MATDAPDLSNARAAKFALHIALATIGLGIVSLPALLNTFGFADDFIAWMWYTTPHFNALRSNMTGDGRFILALLTKFAFSHWSDLHEFVYLRLISIAGWGVFAGLLYSWVLPQKNRPAYRLVQTTAMVLTPAVGVCIVYAVCFPYAWGSVLSLTAGMLAVTTAKKDGAMKRKIALGLVSIILLQIAFLIYQPVAYFFLLPPLIHFKTISWKHLKRCPWTQTMILFGVGTCVYALIYSGFKTGLENGSTRGVLGTLSIERIEHAAYFIWKAFESWAALLPLWLAIPIASGIAILAAISCFEHKAFLTAGLTLLATIALPLMIERVEFFSRLLVATYPVVLYLAIDGATVVARRLRTAPLSRRGTGLAAASGTVSLAVVFSFFTYEGLVRSSVKELAWIRHQAASATEPIEHLYYTMPWNPGQGQSWPGRTLIEYGRLIGIVSPNATALIAFAHAERFPTHSRSRFFKGEITFLQAHEYAALIESNEVAPNSTVWRADLYHVRER